MQMLRDLRTATHSDAELATPLEGMPAPEPLEGSMDEKAPAGLGKQGKALWKGVVSTYQLRVDELQILEDAARTADLIEKLQGIIDGEDAMAAGAMGQDVVHPAIQEVRQQRNSLRQLFMRLDLPDADSGDGRTTTKAGKRQEKASTAAKARWSA